jgi:ABC-type transport system involved in multi-copper enzyme maturation permease subunit
MKCIGIVAWNTFREAVRDRVLYNLVLFAFLMMAAAIFVGQISVGIESTVIVSLGLTAISVIGLLIAVFLGVGLVSKEMDKRTLYAILAKPVRRWQFLVGKFGGLTLTLAVNTLAMGAALLLVLLYVKHTLQASDVGVVVAVYFIWLKLALVVALALLFSCFTSPLLAILFTSGLYVAGLFVEDMRAVHSKQISEAFQSFLRGISYLLPNFQNFDVMGEVAHGRGVPFILTVQNTAYAALYCAIVIFAAIVIFSRRNLK